MAQDRNVKLDPEMFDSVMAQKQKDMQRAINRKILESLMLPATDARAAAGAEPEIIEGALVKRRPLLEAGEEGKE